MSTKSLGMWFNLRSVRKLPEYNIEETYSIGELLAMIDDEQQ